VYLFQFGYSRTGTGVYLAPPRENRVFSYRCSIDMGHAPKSWELIDEALEHLTSKWPGDEYRWVWVFTACAFVEIIIVLTCVCYGSILNRNCCHFCNELCMSLGVGPIPTWVNAMATSFYWLTAPPNAKATRASARAALAATPQSSGWTTQSPP
jgi:hypothetical protein